LRAGASVLVADLTRRAGVHCRGLSKRLSFSHSLTLVCKVRASARSDRCGCCSACDICDRQLFNEYFFTDAGGESWADFSVLLFLLLVNGIVGFIEDHKYVQLRRVVAFTISSIMYRSANKAGARECLMSCFVTLIGS
jgi:hypothetical protein